MIATSIVVLVWLVIFGVKKQGQVCEFGDKGVQILYN